MEIKRPDILIYKNADFRSFNMMQSIEFASARWQSSTIQTGMAPGELEIIYKGLELLGPRPLVILETGMCWGYSTRMFILHVLKYGGELHTIEFRPRKELIEHLTSLDLIKFVNIHEEDSRKFNYWDSPIDYLNLDSEHGTSIILTEYFRFRVFLKPHVSLIGFHDTILDSVKRAIEIISEIDNLEPVCIDVDTKGFRYNLYKFRGVERKEFPACDSSLTDSQRELFNITLI